MNKRNISNPIYHFLFWLVATSILVLVFGRSWNNNLHAFYFISLLLPVVMATSYFFNYYLVPYFLLKKKYFWFTLYFFYTLVLSLYFQLLVIVFSYIYFTQFNLNEIAANIIDQIILLAFVMYAIVFAGSFFVMLQQLLASKRELELLRDEKKKEENDFVELISNRKIVRINYDDIEFIESLSDYIRVHISTGEKIVSKAKISKLQKMLPVQFLRIHRSFIINVQKIKQFSSTEIELSTIQLNIGRSYKKDVVEKLKST